MIKRMELLGAVWLRRSIDKPHAPPELAFAVKPEHRRHGIGAALLTQLVRANPEQSTICLSFVAGKPLLRLYERFGFKVVEQKPDAVVMHRGYKISEDRRRKLFVTAQRSTAQTQQTAANGCNPAKHLSFDW